MACAAGNPSCDEMFLCPECSQCVLCGHPWHGCKMVYSMATIDELHAMAHGLGELESLAKGVYDKCLAVENKSNELATNDEERQRILDDILGDLEFLKRAVSAERKSVLK